MKKDRLKEIINIIKFDGRTDLKSLENRFNVSNSTIRRDIITLEKAGYVTQLKGGGIVYRSNYDETAPSMDERLQDNIEEKFQIAEYSVGLIREEDTVMIGPGTLTFLLGKIVTGIPFSIRVITNCLSIAHELSKVENIISVMVGGRVINDYSTGFEGEGDAFGSIHYADKLFLTADGVDTARGITFFNDSMNPVLKRMMEVAKEKILIVDSTKIGKVCFTYLCDLKKIDRIVTDNHITNENYMALEKTAIPMEIVKIV